MLDFVTSCLISCQQLPHDERPPAAVVHLLLESVSEGAAAAANATIKHKAVELMLSCCTMQTAKQASKVGIVLIVPTYCLPFKQDALQPQFSTLMCSVWAQCGHGVVLGLCSGGAAAAGQLAKVASLAPCLFLWPMLVPGMQTAPPHTTNYFPQNHLANNSHTFAVASPTTGRQQRGFCQPSLQHQLALLLVVVCVCCRLPAALASVLMTWTRLAGSS